MAHAESPECTPASSMCSITPPITTSPLPSRSASTSTSIGVFEEAVDQHRALGRQPTLTSERSFRGHLRHRLVEAVDVEDDLHGARRRARTTAGPAPGKPSRSATARAASGVPAMPPGGCAIPISSQSRWKRSRSSARSIESGLVPRTAIPAASSVRASFSGVCPPSATMTPAKPPVSLERSCRRRHTAEHVLGRERLEEEAVAGVVVGGDGLGIAVEHHGLETRVRQREGGVHTAVVELDSLTDAVGTAAEDDDGRPIDAARPRPRLRRCRSDTACAPRTRPRTCRPSCR